MSKDKLSDELMDELIDLLRRSVRGFKHRMIQDLKGHHLTVPQVLVLRILNKEGVHTLNELANQLDMSTSSLSGIVDRLVNMQLVTRERDNQDRRNILISLSDIGKKRMVDVLPLQKDYFRNIIKDMDLTGTQILVDQLRKFVIYLEEDKEKMMIENYNS